MATDVSTGRSTNDLLAAATQGDADAVEALYTHYLQFGIDVAMEHGSPSPLATYDQAFLETMAHSLELSRGEPGSFANHIEQAIQGLAAAFPSATASASATDTATASTGAEIEEADPAPETGSTAEPVVAVELPAVVQPTRDATPSVEADAVAPVVTPETNGTRPATDLDARTEAPVESADAEAETIDAETDAADDALGLLPLAATAPRPRTPNQLFDRLHARSLVTAAATLALLALIGWVFVQSTSPADDPGADAESPAPADADPAG
ncbi:MAG: hypothetical protein AAFO29_17415 [Actinomycetota bacterium]